MAACFRDRGLPGDQGDQLQIRSLQMDCHSPVLMAVHVCIRCGRFRRREDIISSEIGTGIFRCPDCQSTGPLNIEIRSVKELEGQMDLLLLRGSSG
jgi:DNA-directed RNA polymerase subunit RPC12/RpoP